MDIPNAFPSAPVRTASDSQEVDPGVKLDPVRTEARDLAKVHPQRTPLTPGHRTPPRWHPGRPPAGDPPRVGSMNLVCLQEQVFRKSQGPFGALPRGVPLPLLRVAAKRCRIPRPMRPASSPDLIPPQASSVLVIRPRRGWAALDLGELWRYRDLLWLLALRDVKLRYKQTGLGILWVILQPAAAALIFAVVFGRFAGLPSDGMPYLLFAFAGVLPWNFLAGVLQRAGSSVVADSRLISKVYFPRLLIPLGAAGAVMLDLLVGGVILFAMMAVYGIPPTFRLLLLPALLVWMGTLSFGISLWVAALNVRYRDFAHALPFAIQVWMYASPVAWPASLVPERWRMAFDLNPATSLLTGFRWCLLGGPPPSTFGVCASLVLAALGLISGAYLFRRVERTFADLL